MKKLLFSVILAIFIAGLTYSQELLWSQSENVNALHTGLFIKTDANNNVYVGARGLGSMYVIKYDQGGTMQFISGDNNTTSFNGMEVNNEGRSFLAGSRYDVLTKIDGLLHVYNPDGTEHYTQYYNYIDETDDFKDIFVDDNDNAYVTGETHDFTDYRALTIKYSPAGAPQWIKQYGSGSDRYMGMQINVNASGEAFVTGVCSNTNLQTIEVFAIKYDAAGNLLSEFRSSIGGYSECTPVFALLDDNDNLFIGGILHNTGPDFAGFLIRVTDGNLIWTQTFESPNDYIILYDGTMDAEGNIIIAGLYRDGIIDAYYARISPTGGVLYEKTYNRIGDGSDAFTKVITKDEFTYLCGTAEGIGTMNDYLILKVNANGEKMWEAFYNGFDTNEDVAYDIVLDNEDNVIVTGSSYEQAGQCCTTLKFSNPLGIQDEGISNTKPLSIYPNPAASVIYVSYEPEFHDAVYTVKDLSGRLMSSGLLMKSPLQKIDIADYSGGIYMISIDDGSKQYNAKFVKK